MHVMASMLSRICRKHQDMHCALEANKDKAGVLILMMFKRRFDTSKTGTLKVSSSLCRVAAARELLQLLIKRSGGGLLLG